MRLSVIIPTIGRESLADAIRSCAGADEIVVVVDEAAGDVTLPRLPANAVRAFVSGGDNGYTARAHGMKIATGTHLAFLDDDDEYLPGAIALMLSAAGDRPVIFQMDHPQHGILWRNPVLEFGNVGTPMFLVPNDPERLGVWAPHAPGLREPGGDFTFIAGCVEQMGEPVWIAEVVAVVRPHPSIAIVTPWWNHHLLAADYLAAVDVRRSHDELVVVDNASEPPLEFAACRLVMNAGFSHPSNVGLQRATADAVLFLNNDIAMTRTDWLEQIRAALEPGVLVGAQLRTERHGDVDGNPLPYLDGWCVAGMRGDLVELGGWDEDYQEPSYYGDNDLSLRARAAGMRLREVRVGLHHKLSRTARDGDSVKEAAAAANRQRFAERAREILGEAVAA